MQDKEALRLYRHKRAEWLEWLLGEDDHAIGRQIWLMSWSYITYRVINEARRIAVRQSVPSPVRNDPFFEFATAGFVATQALAIRRLDEGEARAPSRQITSLRRLVEDVRRHRDLFSREIFVGFDGAPFDPEPGQQRWWEQAMERLDQEGGADCRSEGYEATGADAWRHAERLHDEFDRLSGASPGRRQRVDRVPDQVFSKLVRLLDDPAIGKARALANKSTPPTRCRDRCRSTA